MKRKLSLLLSIFFLFALSAPVMAKSEKTENAVLAAIKGYQKGTDTIFSQDVLSSVGTGAEWLVFAAARAGHADNYSKYLSALDTYVQENLRTKQQRTDAYATDLQRIALAILSAGGDPTSFSLGEDGNPVNFIKEGVYDRCIENDGNKTGTLGAQGTNGFVWGLLTLDSNGFEVPEDALYSRAKIVNAILATQNTDGGFAIYGSDSDNDMTATTITALAPYYKESEEVRKAVDRALELLMTQQQESGDFKNSDFPGFPGSPNSVTSAQVLTALCALGIDAQTDSRFIKNGNTLLNGIMKYQKADGTFAYDLNELDEPYFSYGGEQVLYSLVAYSRFSNNERNLFDFTGSAGSTDLIFAANGKNYTLTFDKSQLTYELELPDDTSEIVFKSIPLSPYETAITQTGVAVPYNGQATFAIAGRYGNTVYTIKTKLPTVEVPLEDAISNLPERLTDEHLSAVQSLLMQYEALSMEERERVENYSQLQEKYLVYIQGKDINYITSGNTPEGNRYTWTINGLDIVTPASFDTRILLQSEHSEKIGALAKEPFILHFVHTGGLPGKAKIEIETGLLDGEYELYYYNYEQNKGEKVANLPVLEGNAVFEITHCSDYYLTWLNSGEIRKTDSANTADHSIAFLLLTIVLISGMAGATAFYQRKQQG